MLPRMLPALRRLPNLAMTGAALGVVAWLTIELLLAPLLLGAPPRWSASEMRALFPHLAAWVLAGAALAALAQLAPVRSGAGKRDASAEPRQICVLGGGFAGVNVIRELERRFGPASDVSFTLVSDVNSLLFTPMLSEVVGSSIEASHITTPLRTSVRRTRVVRAQVSAIEVGVRRVALSDGSTLAYDDLVIALGAVPNFFGLSNLQQRALPFKSVADATRLRNRVLNLFDAADRESDGTIRRRLLSFVVAGGGFAGTELAGALNDFARGILADFPRLQAEDVSVVVVHAGDRILPELSASLATYACERMRARGVHFRLGTRVVDAGPGWVRLADGSDLAADTLVWTAGTTPNPLARACGLRCDARGAAIVDSTLVTSAPNVWAIGDCAAVTDAESGKLSPPTAQFALRQAATAAFNLHARYRRRRMKSFRYRSLGALCVVGYQTACAELSIPFAHGGSMRFSGFVAWLMWRAIYLSKLPGTERKLRVAVDWLAELAFPRDIAQTEDAT